MTSLTGVYGDRMGVPIGNSLRYFNPTGASSPAGSFAYWTDPLDSFVANLTDTTPQMIDRQGKTHPGPWVPFTRAGCDVGAFATANIELENIGLDITTVFGANSPEAKEAQSDPSKAVADFEGIAVHCAQGSALCPKTASQLDLLPQEPEGYSGFRALFGNKFVEPQISPQGRSRTSTATSSRTAAAIKVSLASTHQRRRLWAIWRRCSRQACRWSMAILPTRTMIT